MHCWLAKLKQWVLLRECFPLNIANIQTLEEEAAGARPGLGRRWGHREGERL